jgi:hypothetical protein
MISHIGTGKRPKLFIGAAVGNIGQWAKAWSSNIAWVMTVIISLSKMLKF